MSYEVHIFTYATQLLAIRIISLCSAAFPPRPRPDFLEVSYFQLVYLCLEEIHSKISEFQG